MVFCTEPEYVETIMTQPVLWAKLHMHLIPITKQIGPGLFTANDDEDIWGQAHRILLPAFSVAGMKQYFTIIQGYVNQLLSKWDELAKNGTIFDPNPWLAKFTFDVIGNVSLGLDLKAIVSEELHPFLKTFEELMEIRDKQREHPLRNALIPPRALNQRAQVLTNQLKKFIQSVIDQKRKELSESKTKNNDLITLMLDATDPKTGKKLPDENVVSQVFTFLVAGHDSTSTALTMLFYHIAQDAKVEDSLVKEIQELVGDGDFTWDQASKLEYGLQVIKENLRMYPPALSIVKTVTSDAKIGPYFVPNGTRVMVSIHGLHRNPAVYPDPDRFDPDRFTPQQIAKRNPYAWIPFSAGPRACIGMQLSLLEQKSLLVTAIRKFSFRLDSTSHLVLSNPLFLKPHGVKIKIHNRERTGSLLADIPRSVSTHGIPKQDEPKIHLSDSKGGSRGQLVILFGSNTGTAQGFANQLAAQGQSFGFETVVNSLDHILSPSFPNLKQSNTALIIITATYNGQPPDNAEQFSHLVTETKQVEAAKKIFKDIKYAVFGCGNSQWKTYQVFPLLVDRSIEKLGGTRFSTAGRGDADASLDDDFLAWKNHMWVDLFNTLGLEFTASEEHEFPILEVIEHKKDENVTEDKEALKDFLSSLGAKFSTIIVNKELQGEGSDRSTRHIEIKRPSTISSYTAGDHLGVLPINNSDLVEEAAKILKVDLDTVVVIKSKSGTSSPSIPYDTPITIRTLLRWGVEIQSNATRSQISFLSTKTECPPEKKRLENLASPQGTEYGAYILQAKRTVLELLNEFKSVQITFREYLSIMPFLKPRFYSISSSSLLFPDSIHITVGVIRGESVTGRKYFGACSDYLSRTKSGDFVRIFVKDNKSSFRLPKDSNLPIIMIGPGTGLAPMRGFIQERSTFEIKDNKLPTNVLFFGCRSDLDFIYKEELEKYAKDGKLKLEVAFSRKQSSKVYVQDKLAQQGELVWKLLQAGAHIYICGDAKFMAKDVKKAFLEIIKTYGHFNDHGSEEYLNHLSFQKRYCEDVWAATN